MPVDLDYQSAITASFTRITRRVDIYEDDGTTPWKLNVPVKDGSVTVSQGRAERRMFSMTIDNSRREFKHYPGGLWYDKIIRPFRGVETDVGSWETDLGYFVIDDIQEQDFPHDVQLNGRDQVKRLVDSKFTQSTTFASGQAIENTIKTIATNGGIAPARMLLPVTGKTLATDYTFDRGSDRWKAITDIATAFGYDLYFDAQGYFVMSLFQDPLTSPLAFSFVTGVGGTVSTFTKKTSDTRIKNHIAVTGESNGQPLVFAEALNLEPDSPTRISNPDGSTHLGDRQWEYVSAFITTQAQAQDIADTFLKTMALESFDLNLDTLVIPWLDVGQIIGFEDPDPAPGDPTRYLLSDLTIPLKLGAMQVAGKRVTVVG